MRTSVCMRDMNFAGKILKHVPLRQLLKLSQTQKAVGPHCPDLGLFPSWRENTCEC